MQKLTRDLAAAKTTHEAELKRLLDARQEVEGQLMKERDLAVKRVEDLDAQIQAAQTKYDLALASLHRADLALAGMPCFPAPLLFRADFLVLRSHSSFWLTFARCLAQLYPCC